MVLQAQPMHPTSGAGAAHVAGLGERDTTGASIRDFDNFTHDLRHGSSAGPAQPTRDSSKKKKKALQVATGMAGTLTR